MARPSTTADAQYERLAKLAISPEDKARKSSLFATFVNDFAAQLLPDVKYALETEASSSEIADEWILEATTALKNLAELPADLEQRAEFQRAVDLTKKELTAEFCKDMLKPSDAEMRRESIELAQCILANWFSLLEHAKTDKVLSLTANGIPEKRSLDDLLEGVEAFAVSRDKLAALFDEFLTSHVEIGDTRALAPQLILARKSVREFFIAQSEEDARSVLLPKTQTRRKHSALFKHINDLLGSETTAATSDPSLSPQVQNYLAWAAARLACTVNTEALSPGTTLGMDQFSRGMFADLVKTELDLAPKLPANLATIALDDLESALGSGKWHRFVSWRQRHAIESSVKTQALAAVGERTVPSLRRIATVAAGYAVACKITTDGFDESENFMDGLEQILENNPKAQAVLYLSAAAAQQAASMPRATAICTRMSQQFDMCDFKTRA